MDHRPSWPLGESVTAEELPAILARHRLVIIHCWAIWNGYDKQMAGMLYKLRPIYQDRISFFAMDADHENNAPFLRTHDVLNVPALVCLVRRAWHETLLGNRPKQELIGKLDGWLEAAESSEGREPL